MKIRTLLLLIATLLFSAHPYALGLGKLKIESALSQPLAASIPIKLKPNENIDDVHVALASQDIFKKMGVEFGFQHRHVKVVIDRSNLNQPLLRMSTDSPFNEPFIELIVHIKTPTQQFNRSLTLLLDTPNNDNAPSVFH